MDNLLYFNNYDSSADIVTISLCIVIFIFIRTTYTTKKAELRLLELAVVTIFISSYCRATFHHLRVFAGQTGYALDAFHLISNTMIIATYVIFVLYLLRVLRADDKRRKIGRIVAFSSYSAFFLLQIIYSVSNGVLIRNSQNEIVGDGIMVPFKLAYLYYSAVCVMLIVFNKKRFITRMFWCLFTTTFMMYMIIVIESMVNETSYLTFTFIIPVLVMLFLFHYNSFDSLTGTLDYSAMKGYIDEIKKTEFGMIVLWLPDADETMFERMSEDFYHFNEQFFKNPITFKVSDKFIMVNRNFSPDRPEDFIHEDIIESFYELYEKYHMDYKIVFLMSDNELVTADHYLSLIDMLLQLTPINSVHYTPAEEVDKYKFAQKIQQVLDDINTHANLEDERVLVYCQPVKNIETNEFSTAEALVRMKIDGLGMVFPDQFIDQAERTGCIHSLSKIILNKTCQSVRQFIDEGYRFDRVSVNFSFVELREKSFCSDVLEIIEKNDIPYDKIAIELTESRNERDYEAVLKVMSVLHEKGIKFYLDDFGTGYSNFERILSLPIDIIKFDRSLTISSGKNEEDKIMVSGFSDIFVNTGYRILFEGVEDDMDEQRCCEMNAKYLQGYKYSKPIPISELRNFLSK